MEHEKEMVSTGSSDHGTAMVVRTLYPPAPSCVTSASAANGPPSWMEPDTDGQDAPISVWWDYPPS
jgi:hypothetical protein